MGFYKEEQGGKLVPTSGVPQEVALAIERADEETIIQNLTGEFGAENFMYHYPIKGGDVFGIGVDGAKEIARLLGNIEVLPDIKVDKDSDPDYIYAMVRARNAVNNVTLVGVGRQCKYYLTEGNIPTDRINEYAFVIAVTKGQRNAILSVAPQETIAKIIQSFKEMKKIKKIPPAYGKPTPTKPKAPVAAKPGAPATGADEEKLKNLRKLIAVEWQKTGKTADDRKEWQKTEYGVESMSELGEEQLNEMLTKVKALQPSFSDLGFSSETEQKQMRHDFFKLLAEAGYDTDEKKREYLREKSIVHTAALSRDNLVKLIQEVSKQKGVLEEAESIPEES